MSQLSCGLGRGEKTAAPVTLMPVMPRRNQTMRVVILITSILLFGAGATLAFFDKTGGATATYSAAVFGLIFVFLPEFKKFKGFGIEAELLEKKIKEADEIINRLKGMSVPMSELLFTIVARSGRLDSVVPRRENFRLVNEIQKELTRNGVSETELERAKRDWHRYNLFDLARPVVSKIINAIDPQLKSIQQVINTFSQPITGESMPKWSEAIEKNRAAIAEKEEIVKLYHLDYLLTAPSVIKESIQKSHLLNADEQKKLLQEIEEDYLDLAHYSKTHEIRRPEIWFGTE